MVTYEEKRVFYCTFFEVSSLLFNVLNTSEENDEDARCSVCVVYMRDTYERNDEYDMQKPERWMMIRGGDKEGGRIHIIILLGGYPSLRLMDS